MARSHLGKNLVILASLVWAGLASFRLLQEPLVDTEGTFTDGARSLSGEDLKGARLTVWSGAENLGPGVNTASFESSPTLTPDSARLFFQVGKRGENAELWVADWDGSRALSPRALHEINTASDELAPATDGFYLYFSSDRSGGQGGLDLYRARLTPDGVGAPEPMAPPTNSPANETDPVIRPATGDLFFVSDRDRTRGDFDLYQAGNGGVGFGAPEPLADLNSAGDERSPAFSPDGNALWFASDRDGGQGGFDLWRTVWKADTFLPPEALAKLNSPENDVDPWPADDGFSVLFSSDRYGDDFGHDLYRARSRELFLVPSQSQTWMDLTQLILLLVVALLAWLAKRWSALEILYKCILASIILHVLLLWWFKSVTLEYDFPEPVETDKTFRVRLAMDTRSHREQLRSQRTERGDRVDRSTLQAMSVRSRPAPVTPTMPNLDPARQRDLQRSASAVPNVAHADVQASKDSPKPRIDLHTASEPPLPTVQPTVVVATPRTTASRSQFRDDVDRVDLVAANPSSTQPTKANPLDPSTHDRNAPSLQRSVTHVSPRRDQDDSPKIREPDRVDPKLLVTDNSAVRENFQPRVFAQSGPDPSNPTRGSVQESVPEPDRPAPSVSLPKAPDRADRAALAGMARRDDPQVQRRDVTLDAPLLRSPGPESSPMTQATSTASVMMPKTLVRSPAQDPATPSRQLQDGLAADQTRPGTVESLSLSAFMTASTPQVTQQRQDPQVHPQGMETASPTMKPISDPSMAIASAGSGRTVPDPSTSSTMQRPDIASRTRPQNTTPGPGLEDLRPNQMNTLRPSPKAMVSAKSWAADISPRHQHLDPLALRSSGDKANPSTLPTSTLAKADSPTDLKRPDLDPVSRRDVSSATPSDPSAQKLDRPSPVPDVKAARTPDRSRPSPFTAKNWERTLERPDVDVRTTMREVKENLPLPIAKSRASLSQTQEFRPRPQDRAPRRLNPLMALADPTLIPSSLEPLTPERDKVRALERRSVAIAVAPLPEFYRGRFGDEKEVALRKFGGSEETEEAVRKGLAYLASIQSRSGYWGDREDYDKKYGYVLVGKTALAMLAFMGAGHTPGSGTEYSQNVDRIIDLLISIQDADTGHFGYTSSYSHAIATYALAECYAIDPVERVRDPLEKAVQRIVTCQNRDRRDPLSYGGWAYYYPDGHDYDRFPRASITSWQVMALKSALLGGLKVDDRVFQAARSFLENCFDKRRGWYRYNHDPKRLRSDYPTLPGSTPASVFALGLLGADTKSDPMERAFEFMMDKRPKRYRWRGDDAFIFNAEGNLYFWYYATLAMIRRGGADWTLWNESLKAVILPAQNEDGSWEPISIYARYAGDDGRDKSYTTAMCVLMMEVYYRYLTPLLDDEWESR